MSYAAPHPLLTTTGAALPSAPSASRFLRQRAMIHEAASTRTIAAERAYPARIRGQSVNLMDPDRVGASKAMVPCAVAIGRREPSRQAGSNGSGMTARGSRPAGTDQRTGEAGRTGAPT